MERWQRRAVRTVAGVVVLAFLASLAYHYLMVVVEGRSPRYLHSTQVVVETLTGTGYGSDSPWESTVGNLFVIAMDLSTFLILFIVVPYVFQPVLEEALSPAVPREVEVTDHVVVCGYTSRGERLVEEFETRSVDYVVVVANRDQVLELQEAGISVIQGDPTSAAALERARVEEAASVVVDTDDEHAASAVLAVREHDEWIQIVVLCTDLSLEQPIRYAGADAVMTPRHLLAQRIAERVQTEINPRVSDVTSLGEDLALVEVTIAEDSPFHGQTIGETGLIENGSVTVVGLWTDGEFVASPAPDTPIDEQLTILVAGPESELKDLERRTRTEDGRDGSVVVAGYGEVGGTVSERLRGSAVDCTVVDLEDDEGVDVVGNATDEEVLRRAGIEAASSFVIAIADDAEAILSVLVARELAPELDIVVRMNDSANEAKARRAGADYVLNLPDISGRLLALDVLREEIISYDRQLKIVRYESDLLVGRELRDTPLPELNCTLIAVERSDGVVTDISPSFTFERGDSLLLAGDDEAIDELESRLA
ncbi:Trk K+ transport system, NAD-binding component [Halobiforma haloterrestris]|uniref:Trk K+ transport system, NAD-binding component n=1 Tax=Natronobacterium haloterrestre TaxID=148448 RepID=A0A1I1DBE6_NATHA|nr:NAD-binding protein [Halobiforma haloterrestris]SFB71682.1 Trk K+ transport system, NAD-binding component [Halobiforma haloterrestris]